MKSDLDYMRDALREVLADAGQPESAYAEVAMALGLESYQGHKSQKSKAATPVWREAEVPAPLPAVIW